MARAAAKVADPWDRSHVRQQPVLHIAHVVMGGSDDVDVVPVYAVNQLGGLLVDVRGHVRWVPAHWVIEIHAPEEVGK